MKSVQSLVVFCLALCLVSASASSASQFTGQESPVPASAPAQQVELQKQPVFLFCPHKESASAWSLYVVADKNNPSKLLSLGLEALEGKNSKDHTYRGVLAAQTDPNTQRTLIAQLNAGDFAGGKLEVKENNLLSIKPTQTQEGLMLTIDARVSLDGYFTVGGAQQNHRCLMLKYNSVYNQWQATATRLENTTGQNVVGKYGMTLTGIVFLAGTTSVSRIAAVDPFGKYVILMDK